MGTNNLVEYAVAGVRSGTGRGYLAIGFVDETDDMPPLSVRTREESRAVVRVSSYEKAGLHGKALYVLSSSEKYAVNRLRKLAGDRPLKLLARETLQDLPQLQ